MRTGLAGLALAITMGLSACGGPVKQRAAAPPSDLNRPQRDEIRLQLLSLFALPGQCMGLLQRANGLGVSRLPDSREQPQCARVNTVLISRAPVPLATQTPVTCPLAAGIYLWQRDSVLPLAQRHFGQPVARLETFGTYACRTRNNQPGARMSEHASANAIDIAAFVLADGTRIAVKTGWNGPDRTAQRFLREVFRGGCRYFSVALGPDSDRFHQDHLHFDLGPWPKCG